MAISGNAVKGLGRFALVLVLGWGAVFLFAALFSSDTSVEYFSTFQGSSEAVSSLSPAVENERFTNPVESKKKRRRKSYEGNSGIVARPHPPGWNPDPMAYPKPRVFFEIAIDGKPAGRVIFELFTKQSPLAAENFRALCTGEKGLVPNEPGREGAGQPLHFKGKEFYRVIDQFICQTGAGTESIYGGAFKDDPGGLILRHDRKGLLSVANLGPDTTTSHFSIMMAPAHHLDGSYVIFGEVVEGFEVVQKINKLAKPSGSKDERPILPVVIADCGQL